MASNIATILSPSTMDADAWDDLLSFIEERRVIPIVGPELLQIRTDKGPRLLHDWAAEKLAARLNVDSRELPQPYTLNDVVCWFLAARGRREEAYVRLRSILKDANFEPPPALRQLAAITDFDLFVSTTWFGMDRLEAGDDYDRKIRQNIARCSYFIPVISANTERRVEAYLGRAGRTAEAVTASKAVLAAERRLASRNRTDRLQPYELALALCADALAEPAHAAANLAEAAKIMNSLQPQVAALVGPKELRGWIRQAQARH